MSATVDAGTNLRQIIHERLSLSEAPDPHVIAAEIAADLPEESLREIVRVGLVCLVQTEVRRERRTGSPSRSAKWDAVRDAVGAHPDIFQRRYKTPGGWKFLGDFTRADAQWNRDQHRTLAAQCEQRAHQFEVLAKRLRERGIVRDQLKAGDVEEIFNA